MIHTIEIQGFRSLRDTRFDLRPLNVLIGPNQSGKTNVLDALDLLKQAAQGRLSAALYQTRGGLSNLLWAGKGNQQLRFKIKVPPLDMGLDSDEMISFSFALSDVLPNYFVSEEVVTVDLNGTRRVLYEFPDYIYNEISDEPENFDHFKIDLHELGISQFRNVFSYNGIASLREQFESISVYPGFETKTRWASEHPNDTPQIRQPQFVANSTELEPLGGNLVNVLYTMSQDEERWGDFKEMVRSGFPDFENIVFPADAGQGRIALAWVDRRFPKRRFTAEVLSAGTLCFLAWAAALAAPESPTLIAIDEPEQHLHPELLYRLVGLLEQASAKHQIIVTTHSDALLSYLSEPEKSVVLVNNGPDGTTLTRPPEADLREWLKAYTMGQLREAGHLGAFAPSEP